VRLVDDAPTRGIAEEVRALEAPDRFRINNYLGKQSLLASRLTRHEVRKQA
jgi:hypothetical protein